MLDRVDPGPQGRRHPALADRVGGHGQPQPVGLVDQGVQLGLGVGGLAGVDAHGQHPPVATTLMQRAPRARLARTAARMASGPSVTRPR